MARRTNSGYFPIIINLFIFVAEMVCVHCAVRTGFLNIIQVNTEYYDQAVSRRMITARGGFSSCTERHHSCGGQTAAGACCFPELRLAFPFLQCSILVVVHLSLWSEGQAGESLVPSKKEMLWRVSGPFGQISFSCGVPLFLNCRLCH